jgi:hypothetical protein
VKNKDSSSVCLSFEDVSMKVVLASYVYATLRMVRVGGVCILFS